jgi:hypothetical protein
MSTSGDQIETAARRVMAGKDSFAVKLSDGRTIIVPMAWFRGSCMAHGHNGRTGG